LFVKQAVFSPEIQVGVIEKQIDGYASELSAVLLCKQRIVKRMQYPFSFLLHLRGDGKSIILFRKTLAVFLDDFANGYPAYDRRGYCESFDHD
jgi:hypothetical protein